MPNRPIPQSIRQFVINRANGCCEYCVSQEKFSPDPFSVEHIVPKRKGGSDVEDNLAFSCQGCNGHKHTATHAVDPISGDRAPLFNPRIHQWPEHFTWDQDCSIALGKTAIDRATVERLRLNRPGVVNLRQVLRQLDRHPP